MTTKIRLTQKRFQNGLRRLVFAQAKTEIERLNERVPLNFPYKIDAPLPGHLPIPSKSMVGKIRALGLFREEQYLLNFLWRYAFEEGGFRVVLSPSEIGGRTDLPAMFVADTLKKFREYELVRFV